MFLRYLRIENIHGLIRHIDFHQGLNLIVDEVSTDNEETGNNVGKTTVLRLIDFCLVWREIRFTLRQKGLKS